MNELPADARPISNTVGAQKRKEAIERQLPLYDHDATKCHELSKDEAQSMKNYVDFFKKTAIGKT